MKMAVDRVRERLSAFFDGELTPEERREVAAHLEGCEECRRELALLSQLDAALGSLEAAPAPAALAERVLDRVQPRRRYWWQSLAMAASLILGIVLGGSLARDFYPYSTTASNGNAEVLALEEFHDFPQGSLGAVMVSYQAEESNGT